jgi:aldehyde dehydrogenase (NAD+)
MLSTLTSPVVNYIEKFDALRSSAFLLSKSTSKERIKKLNSILNYLNLDSNLIRLEKAVFDDFRKSPSEFRITELAPIISNLKYIKKNLRHWMQDVVVDTPLVLMGTKSYIRHQAKGTVLIMAPWNYPFNLSIIPMLYAISAGNSIALKPSEMTPNTSAFIAEMITQLFPSSEIMVYEGDAKVAQALLELPFNHIFFTGSSMIGKKVMAAAAQNLSSVTLELGGKSPTIIDKNVNLKKTAEKLVWGKLTNSGQTCTAPDYLIINKEDTQKLISNVDQVIKDQYGYPVNEIYKSPDLTRIVNLKHFNRIKNLLDDAILKGAKVELGGTLIEKELFIAPTILSKITDDMLIMEEEIFGPLLPVINCESDIEIINEIRKRPDPLVLYIVSKSRKRINYFIDNTRAGGTVVNDFLIHYGNPDLPFGGVNNSGIGKSNGKHGFIEFSNERGVMKQQFGTLKMIYPPYTNLKKKLINFLNKIV